MLQASIAAGRAPAKDRAIISLVGAGPGARDLITLRGVQRLQEADVIVYDALLDTGVLELARRDARRICIADPAGLANGFADLLISTAREGKRVVRLRCGGSEDAADDPETLALAAAGLPWEVVPGVPSGAPPVAQDSACPDSSWQSSPSPGDEPVVPA